MRLLLALLALLALPTAAQACESSLNAAAAEVEQGAGLSPSTLRDVRSACGEGGPASLVAVLVRNGSCDHAAQLARSLPGSAAMEGGLAAADACLTGQLESSLDALADAADEAEAAGAEQQWGAADLDAPAPRAQNRSGEPKADAATGGLLAELGTRGIGYGAGGSSRSRPMSKSDGRAATGVGHWEPGPSKRREIGVRPGATVAWTRLSFGIWFDYDSSALRSEGLGTVGTLARTLRDMEDGTVLEVVGHTDSTGSWYYNQSLSTQRAQAVRQALMLAGVPGSKLSVFGAGEDQPVADNYSSTGRARNRRVEFRFYRPIAARPVTR